MANNKAGNWQTGKQGFQKKTPQAEEPRRLTRRSPDKPVGLPSGITNEVYMPRHTIMSTIRHYTALVKNSFRSKGWQQRESAHAEQTARLGLK